MVESIQAIPICYHMNLCSPSLTPNFDLPWPLRPLCDLLDNFFQLQNVQLNWFFKGTPSYVTKTCATWHSKFGILRGENHVLLHRGTHSGRQWPGQYRLLHLWQTWAVQVAWDCPPYIKLSKNMTINSSISAGKKITVEQIR